MLTAPSGDWSVFQRIFADHWQAFQHAHPRYQTAYYAGLVAKRLACGNPPQRGSVEYRCLPCGQGKHLVSMRCTSSVCLRCAKVYTDAWVSQVSKVRHEGVSYRHLLLTVPAMLRTTFDQQAAVVLSACRRCGGQCLDDVYRPVKGQPLKGGSMVGLHPHGGTGQDPPHLPLLAPSGGDDGPGECWEHLAYLPYALLRHQWQGHLLTMLRQPRKTEAIHQVVDPCFRKYPNGLVTNVHTGQVPSPAPSVARYVARYVVSPPISVRRMDRYDGEWVTDHYRSHRTDRVEQDTGDVLPFLGRMVPHTRPKGCKRMRYDGGQATQTLAQGKGIIHAALAKVEGGIQGAVKIIARLTYRQR
jgi:hypothetical protein